MGLPRDFHGLCRAPRGAREALRDRLLAAAARMEWPLTAHLRERLARAGLDPRRVRGARDLLALPALDLRQLAQVEPERLVPLPEPRRVREHWSWSRKLGLVVAGSQGGARLARGYAVTGTREHDLGGGVRLRVGSTQHDQELLEEQAARCLDVLADTPWPADEEDRRSTHEEADDELVAALAAGALRVQRARSARGAAAVPGIGGADRVHPPLHVHVPGTDPHPPWGAAHGLLYLAAERLLLPRAPEATDDGPAFLLWPDLAWLEELDGTVQVTHLAHHGTLLVRARAPHLAGWRVEERPDAPHPGLPRLVPPRGA